MFTQSSSLGLQIAFLIGNALPLSSVRLSNPRTRLSKTSFRIESFTSFCLPTSPTPRLERLGPASRGTSPEPHCVRAGLAEGGGDPRGLWARGKQAPPPGRDPPPNAGWRAHRRVDPETRAELGGRGPACSRIAAGCQPCVSRPLPAPGVLESRGCRTPRSARDWPWGLRAGTPFGAGPFDSRDAVGAEPSRAILSSY